MIPDETQIRSLAGLFSQVGRVVLATHKSPDGDGLGSMCALSSFLDELGIESLLVSQDKLPDQCSVLKDAPSFWGVEEVGAFGGDAVILCDSGDAGFAGLDDIMSRLPGKVPVVNVDHHVSNTSFGQINIVDPGASSTCEVVYRVLESFGAEISPDMATALLLGIVVDTGNFSNPSTNHSSFEVAGSLLEKGASHKDVVRSVFSNHTSGNLRLWGKALKRLSSNADFSLVSTYLLEEDFKEDPTARSEGISNFLNNVPDTRATLLLREEKKGTVRGSLRSTSQCDVSKIAKLLGGGGHKKSAGFTVEGSLRVEDDRISVI